MEFSCGRVPKEEREEHFREQIIKNQEGVTQEENYRIFTKSGVSSANLAPFKHSIIMRDDF